MGDNAIVEGLKLALKERGELKAFTGGVDRVQNWLGIDGIKIISRRNPFLFLKVFIELRNAKAFLLTGGTPIYGGVSQMLINYLIVLICRLYGIGFCFLELSRLFTSACQDYNITNFYKL